MRLITLFLIFISSIAFADSYREQIKRRDIQRDLKLKEGYSNYREEYELESNPLEESYSVQSNIQESPVNFPQETINQGLPMQGQGMPQIPQGLTKEQATELGRALLEAQKKAQPSR